MVTILGQGAQWGDIVLVAPVMVTALPIYRILPNRPKYAISMRGFPSIEVQRAHGAHRRVLEDLDRLMGTMPCPTTSNNLPQSVWVSMELGVPVAFKSHRFATAARKLNFQPEETWAVMRPGTH